MGKNSLGRGKGRFKGFEEMCFRSIGGLRVGLEGSGGIGRGGGVGVLRVFIRIYRFRFLFVIFL